MGAVFVGRNRELGTLVGALDDLSASGGSVFLVTGEAGIGKTQLAERFARLAAVRGARVVWGRCWEGGGAPAHWPWIQVLRSLAADPDLAALIGELGPEVAELAQLAPAASSSGRAPAQLDPAEARFRLFD